MGTSTRILPIGAALLFAVMALTGLHNAIIAGAVGALLYATLFDRRILHRLGNWKFWLLMVSVTLLAGVLLGANPVKRFGVPISTEGLVAGVMMSLRAFTLIASGVLIAGSISRERFFAASSRIGARHIGSAFEEAVVTLPKVRQTWKLLRKRADTSVLDALALLLVRMNDIAEGWPHGRVFGITGGRGAGKTTLITTLAKEAEAAGVKTAGIRQQRMLSEEGATFAYDVCRWPSDEGLRIAEGTPGSGYEFSAEAFESAANWLMEDTAEAELVVIDELGMLESHGLGHSMAVRSILRQHEELILVATLRKDRVDALSEMFGIGADQLIDLENPEADRDAFASSVIAAVRERREKRRRP